MPEVEPNLAGCTVLLHVFSDDGLDASKGFRSIVTKLKGRAVARWSPHVTHVVWKNGKNSTLLTRSAQNGTPVINSGWLLQCEEAGGRVSEQEFQLSDAAVRTAEASSKKRKREAHRNSLSSLPSPNCMNFSSSQQLRHDASAPVSPDDSQTPQKPTRKPKKAKRQLAAPTPTPREPSSEPSNPVIVGASNLEPTEMDLLNHLCSMSGASLSDDATAMTHLVVGSPPRRTRKVMIAVATNRVQLVQPSWLFESLDCLSQCADSPPKRWADPTTHSATHWKPVTVPTTAKTTQNASSPSQSTSQSPASSPVPRLAGITAGVASAPRLSATARKADKDSAAALSLIREVLLAAGAEVVPLTDVLSQDADKSGAQSPDPHAQAADSGNADDLVGRTRTSRGTGGGTGRGQQPCVAVVIPASHGGKKTTPKGKKQGRGAKLASTVRSFCAPQVRWARGVVIQ